jgi:hypothetical protein
MSFTLSVHSKEKLESDVVLSIARNQSYIATMSEICWGFRVLNSCQKMQGS